MNLYYLLFVVFIFQDPISTNGVLLEAYQNNYNVWIIHLLFIIATLLDAIILYYLGKLFHNRFAKSKIVIYIKERTKSFTIFTGKHSKKLALLIYGPIIFPLSAFISPWLGISFWESTVFLLIGDLIFWYGFEWLLVLGVKSLFPDPKLALFAILTISICISLCFRYFRRKKNK